LSRTPVKQYAPKRKIGWVSKIFQLFSTSTPDRQSREKQNSVGICVCAAEFSSSQALQREVLTSV